MSVILSWINLNEILIKIQNNKGLEKPRGFRYLGSDNSVSPIRPQLIIWSNVELLSIEPYEQTRVDSRHQICVSTNCIYKTYREMVNILSALKYVS